MAFVTGAEVVNRLPDHTTVTAAEAEVWIEAAKARLSESHAPDDVPENSVTKDIVEEYAFLRAIIRHYVAGEAEIDLRSYYDALQRVEERFQSYDARHSTEEEHEAEAPVAYVDVATW